MVDVISVQHHYVESQINRKESSDPSRALHGAAQIHVPKIGLAAGELETHAGQVGELLARERPIDGLPLGGDFADGC